MGATHDASSTSSGKTHHLSFLAWTWWLTVLVFRAQHCDDLRDGKVALPMGNPPQNKDGTGRLSFQVRRMCAAADNASAPLPPPSWQTKGRHRALSSYDCKLPWKSLTLIPHCVFTYFGTVRKSMKYTQTIFVGPEYTAQVFLSLDVRAENEGVSE